MTDLRIAVILGSTRPGRNGKAVADWVMEKATHRTAEYQLLDLADFPLPHLDEATPPIKRAYANEHTRVWSTTIERYDGFVIITPEYNRSTSGVLKNAIDYLYHEWNNKAVAFVGYGSLGATRAVEHLRAISSELQMAHVRQQLSFLLASDFDFATPPAFVPALHHDGLAEVMLDQLEAWAGALKPLRVS